MQTIEIRKGLSIGVDEMVDGASKMETSSLEQFVAKLENLLANRKVKNPSRRERELLAKINQKLPELTQSRYDFLSAKLQDGNYTAAYQSIQYQPDYRHFFGFSLPPAPSEGGGDVMAPPPSEGAGGRLNSYP